MNGMLNSIFAFTGTHTIAITAGMGVFFLVVFFAVLRDEQVNKNARIKRPENEWLFTRWDEKLYDTFFPGKSPERLLVQLGMDLEAYNKNCDIVKKTDRNFKKMAADKIIGFLLFFLGIIVFVLSGINGIFFTLILMVIGLALYEGDVRKTERLAKERKKQLSNELPRFLDLLQTALYIEIPVSDAISITAQHLRGSLVAEELLASVAETQMGSISWQRSLQNIAIKYEVDVFSDFVQYLVNGYEKGLSIYDVVSRQAEEVRNSALIAAEENANKMSTSIIIPIAIFKLFPLIMIVAYPFLKQLLSSQMF